MTILLIVLGLITLIALTNGFSQVNRFRVGLYFRPLREPYFFFLGLSSTRTVYTDRVVDTFEVGLYVVSIYLDFHKPRSVFPITPEEVAKAAENDQL